MAEEERPSPGFDGFDARLEKLRAGARQPEPAERRDDQPERLNFGAGLQAGIEVLAGVGGGVLIGWALDRWLGTGWLMVAGIVLGSVVGFYEFIRIMSRIK